MKFTAKGAIGGKPETVTWDDGKLTGSPFAIEYLRNMAEWQDGEPVGPIMGPYTEHDHLADPLSASILMAEMFGDSVEFEGDLPEREDLPPGAIA